MGIIENENIAKHTTFHIGGPARYFCEVKSIEELKEALEFAEENSLSYFILGGGSNVIASDEGYKGIIIKIFNFQFSIFKEYIECDAGVSLAKVVSESMKNGLIGMEWAWGIPGTVGGAVRGNAGAYGGEMKDGIEAVTVLRNGKIVKLKNKECGFGYRESIFKKDENIILGIKIKLEKGNTERLKSAKEKIDKIKNERGDKFKGGYNAGSFFKNVELKEREIKILKKKFSEIPDQFVTKKIVPAAWLIDQCDLKGFCVGDICVSEKHAGIILNKGKGTSDELSQLVGIIKMKVRDKFNINLEEEIQYL
ncbi:MAG TPA: UDP-N-acetylmuramate dehydrogenase [Patescibacteria group bacterium]|nr:UDP-N-acetylmuramate dehydrogenase [Patescibacteria group bacterium]